jgi:hypothetical protein
MISYQVKLLFLRLAISFKTDTFALPKDGTILPKQSVKSIYVVDTVHLVGTIK